MPVGVVTNEREEHNWERAKQIAKDEGHDKDWQYIMGIYKRMNPERFTKEAHPYVIYEILRNVMELP